MVPGNGRVVGWMTELRRRLRIASGSRPARTRRLLAKTERSLVVLDLAWFLKIVCQELVAETRRRPQA